MFDIYLSRSDTFCQIWLHEICKEKIADVQCLEQDLKFRALCKHLCEQGSEFSSKLGRMAEVSL